MYPQQSHGIIECILCYSMQLRLTQYEKGRGAKICCSPYNAVQNNHILNMRYVCNMHGNVFEKTG